jgi:hypothetical protein
MSLIRVKLVTPTSQRSYFECKVCDGKITTISLEAMPASVALASLPQTP